MRFNVAGLIQDGIGAVRKYDVRDVIEIDGREPEAVEGWVELVCTKGVLVRAHLRLVEPEECARCAAPLEEVVRIDFEEEFHLTVDLVTGGPPVEAPDPDAFMIDAQHELDLTEAVRQYREVSIEMAPLCRPDCRGLCPNCGQDLNLGDCDCEQGTIDSRWAGLAALRGAVTEGNE